MKVSAYLDIETSFLGDITIIGIHIPHQPTIQWIRPQLNPALLLESLQGIGILKTYNGSRFDLPVIQRKLGVDLKSLFPHDDLMYRCWKLNLKGGLKSVERQLGLSRASAGVDGLMAMALWDAWERQGNQQALDQLLAYNRDDVELLPYVESALQEREQQ
jgi:uncharacterized protein